MISFENAYKIVLEHAFELKAEKINYLESLGRTLAEDVISDINMPPFDKSAMDGYACRSTDISRELEQIEIIPAGRVPQKRISADTCSKIMTGAPLPENADTVFKIEDSQTDNNGKVFYTKFKQGETAENFIGKNICRTGEDVKIGDIVLKKGTLIKSPHLAILASAGCTELLVFCRPQIGIIATGSELVEPHIKPENSQIRNSNASQMITSVISAGAKPIYYGIAKDNENDTRKLIEKSISENEITLISGGVSAGDFDYVPKILKELNFEILFDKVSVQPGKPVTFAKNGSKICFGVPGNPVSAFVQFELLIRPLIRKMMFGEEIHGLTIELETDFTRKNADRLLWIPVKINRSGNAEPVKYNGSANINAFSQADAIMRIPEGVSKIKKGEKVYVRQI